MAVLLVVLGLVCLHRGDRLMLILCFAGPLLAVAVTELVAKPFVGRFRAGADQYPSGHCTAAAAVSAVALLILCRPSEHAGRWWVGCAVMPAVLVFVAVQHLGWHDLTEALAGLAAGAGTVSALAAALLRLPRGYAADRLPQSDIKRVVSRRAS